MPIDNNTLTSLAHQFILAEDQREPVEPVTLRYPGMTIEEAYRINALILEEKLGHGDQIAGMKVGATSKAIQQQVGINEPLSGYLLESYRIADGADVPRARLISPRVECEVAFLLGRDLVGPGVTIDDVLAATEGVMASIEIVDSRTRGWQVSARDIVADSLILAGFVLSGRRVPVMGLDLPELGVVLKKNGEVVASAKGADVLGNPANPLVWLANRVAAQGGKLAAGQVVMTGSMTPLVAVDGGDTVEAVFDELGSVSVRFV